MMKAYKSPSIRVLEINAGGLMAASENEAKGMVEMSTFDTYSDDDQLGKKNSWSDNEEE